MTLEQDEKVLGIRPVADTVQWLTRQNVALKANVRMA